MRISRARRSRQGLQEGIGVLEGLVLGSRENVLEVGGGQVVGQEEGGGEGGGQVVEYIVGREEEDEWDEGDGHVVG